MHFLDHVCFEQMLCLILKSMNTNKTRIHVIPISGLCNFQVDIHHRQFLQENKLCFIFVTYPLFHCTVEGATPPPSDHGDDDDEEEADQLAMETNPSPTPKVISRKLPQRMPSVRG